MSFIRKLTAAVITALIAAGTIFPAAAEAANTINRMYSQKYDLTVNMLKSDEETMKAAEEFGRYVIFFSVSDGKSKAKVFLSQSYTLDTALKNSY
ncbi:MAG: hypothetical protein J6X60_12685, partial [Ruminiclostridium sp.]|nr:hypothetical protein [Ruminiclostridium sp.]